jgi:hypothetical protein
MKVDRTKYTAHYENGVVVSQWISVEMELDGGNGESALAALDRSQELVQQWYNSKNIPFENNSVPPGPPPVIQVRAEDRAIGVTVDDIKSCQDLVTLDSYRIIIRGKADLEKAFMERRPELVKRESNQLLDAANQYYKNKKQ